MNSKQPSGPNPACQIQPVLVNKILLEHGTPISLCIVYDCVCPTVAELKTCIRDYITHQAYNIHYLSLYREGLLNSVIDKKTGFERS